MKKSHLHILTAGSATFGLFLSACSADPAPNEVVATQSAQLNVKIGPVVPDDATEFSAEVSVGADGNIESRKVTLEGDVTLVPFDARTLPAKAAEPVVKPPKIHPSLAAKLRPADPAAYTDVIISVSHNAPFPRLTRVLRTESRTSAENLRRFAMRDAETVAVERLRKPFRDAVAQRARELGATVTEEYTMGNGMAMRIPDSAVATLATVPNVLNISLQHDGTPPPATISDGTSLATGMNSDYWRTWMAGNTASLSAALLDSGVRSSHTVFNSPDGGRLGRAYDCYIGNGVCDNDPPNPLYHTQGYYNGHGTAAASIILGGKSSQLSFGLPFRGVSKVDLEYYNIYNFFGLLEAGAVPKAFMRAQMNAVDIVIAEVQALQPFDGLISRAADDAFDQGIMVIAACGNRGSVQEPAAPGNAHKALSIGDYNALTGVTAYQKSGLTADYRIKPDLQAPTKVDTAWNGSDTAMYAGFDGTSGATAFAGGAAAIMYHWYNHAFGLSNRPGNVYSALLAQGDSGTLGWDNGVGRLKLVSASQWFTGTRTVSSSAAMDVPFSIPANRKDLKLALWWPENVADGHNDIDLYVYNPSGTLILQSTLGGSVWEHAILNGNLAAGTYNMRLLPYSMKRSTQLVYYTIVVRQI
ncbi:MAG: S8 family serine peptidase [Polyangiaceae bacterium]|nr:S8 family serine peptidase [Polyangiaceae bacterium]